MFLQSAVKGILVKKCLQPHIKTGILVKKCPSLHIEFAILVKKCSLLHAIKRIFSVKFLLEIFVTSVDLSFVSIAENLLPCYVLIFTYRIRL